MWFLATAAFAWYVKNLGRYNVVYGALGAGIILLVWMYLLAVITLVGCEFNAERERSQSLLSLY
jgi:membrane protein